MWPIHLPGVMGEGILRGRAGAAPPASLAVDRQTARCTGQRRSKRHLRLALLANSQAPASLKPEKGGRSAAACWACVGQPRTPAPVTARAPAFNQAGPCRCSWMRPGSRLNRGLAGCRPGAAA